MLCNHKVTWGKAFLRFSAVFVVFDQIIYIERADVTYSSPFFSLSNLSKDTNQ